MTQILKKLTAAAVILCLSVSACAAVFADSEEAGIQVWINGAEYQLEHQPFIDNEEVYFPLHELFLACGVPESWIVERDGIIDVTFPNTLNADYPVTAHITIGQPGISFDNDVNNRYLMNDSGGMRTTTHPCLMKDGIVYIPLGMLIRIKHFDTVKTDESTYIEGNVYTRSWHLKLLNALEIRQFSPDRSTYDVIVSGPIDMSGANRYNPAQYFGENENVVIGTAQQLDEKGFQHKEVNHYYFPVNPMKHILIDDSGQVICVVPYENQRHEAIDPSGLDSWGGGMTWHIGGGMLRKVGDSSEFFRTAEVVYDDVYSEYFQLKHMVGCFYIDPFLFVD